MRLATTRLRTWVLAAMLATVAAAPARAWWDQSWPLRVKVTADAGPNGANITEPIGRTQILLRLHGGNFDFSQLKDDGGDLRFIAGDDKTPLHYHIEKFSKKDQVALVWIDVPDMAPGTATPFYVYWGNANAADGSDPKGTYDPDQLLVYHFADANGLPADSTGYGSNALTPGVRDEAGLIGDGLLFDGKKPPVRINKNPALAITAAEPMMYAMWVQPSAGTRTSVLFSDRDGTNGLTIGLDNGVPYAEVQGPSGTLRTNGTAALSGEGWHQIVLVASDHLAPFLDNKQDGAAASLPAMNGQMVLGGTLDGSAPGFAGRIDEFAIAKAARPPGAIGAQFTSEGPDAKLLSLDQPEKNKSGSAGYFAVLFRAVTPDAWVVIGLLSLMAMMTWYVMYARATYLNRLGKANAAFRTEYRRLLSAHGHDHFIALVSIADSKSKRLRGSSLARLARIGVHEMMERVSAGRLDADGRLTPQSLDAIRAVMETGLGRETRRANS
jgi:biopolymer transport protein ExbB